MHLYNGQTHLQVFFQYPLWLFFMTHYSACKSLPHYSSTPCTSLACSTYWEFFLSMISQYAHGNLSCCLRVCPAILLIFYYLFSPVSGDIIITFLTVIVARHGKVIAKGDLVTCLTECFDFTHYLFSFRLAADKNKRLQCMFLYVLLISLQLQDRVIFLHKYDIPCMVHRIHHVCFHHIYHK